MERIEIVTCLSASQSLVSWEIRSFASHRETCLSASYCSAALTHLKVTVALTEDGDEITLAEDADFSALTPSGAFAYVIGYQLSATGTFEIKVVTGHAQVRLYAKSGDTAVITPVVVVVPKYFGRA